jgi:hypothetical protein
MRNGPNNNKRMRGRNNNRKNHNPMTRVYESNGPDTKIRGTASHVAEKYLQLARDSQSSGDPVAAENYFQHAEHYFRLIAAMQEQFRQQNPYYREGENRDGNYDDGDEEGGEAGQFGGQFQPREGQHQPREGHYQQRENQQGQPYPPRENYQHHQGQQHREPRYGNRDYQQGNRPQPAPSSPDQDVDRLPAFVTGGAPSQPAPQQNGANGQHGFEGGGDRFPLHRRRRRRHGPRPEMGGGPETDMAPQGGGQPE